ncbi:hypothetical protein HUG17_4184 [Dermatophagoides farinae]|uniref:Chromo domain-containing protein n=1 Tax=Dermatophagoides farinae TaxID=6954 RepID=A0A9D4SHD6_DERFA|nr:hypothetical protein HUG17_4184 [Dermatophagoides farinae]
MTNNNNNNNKKNASKKFKFEIGEKVLCYQDKHIYEAKCVSIRKSNTIIEYLIHYRGWKPKYDEWVLPDRILKYTQDNLKLQQKLRQSNKKSHKKKSKKTEHHKTNTKESKKKSTKKDELKKSTSIDNTNNSVNHNYKNLNSNDIEVPVYIEKQEDFLNKREVKIRIPEDLKTILTDDWELIINQKKLTAKSDPSNSKDSKRLLKKFRKATPKSGNNRFPSSSNRTNESENNNQICIKSSRLPLLFNDQNSQTSETSDSCSTSTEVSSTELQQCQQQNKLDSATMMNMNDKRIDFTKLYGAVHLLRLFTKLGQFLFYTDLNSERINLVNSYIYDFLKYLSKNLWLFANESDTSYIDSFLLDRNTR